MRIYVKIILHFSYYCCGLIWNSHVHGSNPCDQHICQNDGSCELTATGNPSCICPYPFAGRECQENCGDRFPCPEKCIESDWVCDGISHCDNGEDEEGYLCGSGYWTTEYPSGVCRNDEYECSDGQCIDMDELCDNFVDCAFGEDEQWCTGTTNSPGGSGPFSSTTFSVGGVCGSDRFFCTESNQCVPQSDLCDGNIDCTNGEDEATCGCDSDEFFCSESSQCIPESYVCDGEYDCLSGQDEECGTDNPDSGEESSEPDDEDDLILYTVIGVLFALLVIVILIVVIVLCSRRRKRRQNKYLEKSATAPSQEDKEKSADKSNPNFKSQESFDRESIYDEINEDKMHRKESLAAIRLSGKNNTNPENGVDNTVAYEQLGTNSEDQNQYTGLNANDNTVKDKHEEPLYIDMVSDDRKDDSGPGAYSNETYLQPIN